MEENILIVIVIKQSYLIIMMGSNIHYEQYARSKQKQQDRTNDKFTTHISFAIYGIFSYVLLLLATG